MKTNVLMKIAVVLMAAFGAYAFSGNTHKNDQFSYKNNSDVCTNITVACSDSGLYTCRVELVPNSTPVDIWDLECMRVIKHNTSEVFNQ